MAARPLTDDERFQLIVERGRRTARHSAERAALGMTTPPTEPSLLRALARIFDTPPPGAGAHPRRKAGSPRAVGRPPTAGRVPVGDET
jgi:hypothetical protein